MAVALKLCKMAFRLSGKVAALCLESSTAKAYLCNQGHIAFLFLSRLAYHILNLANKHGITLIQAYMHTHLNLEAYYLLRGRLVLEWHLLPCIAQVAFHLWGPSEVDLLVSSPTNQCQQYYTLENPLPLGGLGLNAFTHCLANQVSCVSSSSIGSSHYIQVFSRTCHRSIKTSNSGGILLNGGSLASNSSWHVGTHSSLVSHHEIPSHGCLGRPDA